MGEVVALNPSVVGDGARIDPDRVLTAAAGMLDTVVVIGRDKDGELYFAGSEGAPWTLWLIEHAKRQLFQSED